MSPPYGAYSEPLAGQREAIYETIRQAPGINFVNVQRAHGLATGETMYHLRRLESARLIFSARMGRYRRYWATTNGYGPSPAAQVEADPARAALLTVIRARPGACLSDLARAFPDRSRQATAYHVERLVAARAVRFERSFRHRRFYATATLTAFANAGIDVVPASRVRSRRPTATLDLPC